MARRDDGDWRQLAKDSLNVRNVQPAIKTFRGDAKLAAGYLSLANVFLGDLEDRLTLSGVGYGVRTIKLADGAIIRVSVNEGIRSVLIDATPVISVIDSGLFGRRFVYSQRTSDYPFGFFVDGASIIAKETPWLLERIEELPSVDVDELPQIQINTPKKFFTQLRYKEPPDHNKRVVKNGVDYFSVGNQFYVASTGDVYSFWHTERGDFPAPILFQTSSDPDLEGKIADSAIYNPYLLYDNDAKKCYGFAYSHPIDGGGASSRVIPPVVYRNKSVAFSFNVLDGYVCGVGFYNGKLLTVLCSSGFVITLYLDNALTFVLASINTVSGLVDIPANFVWKFSESGKRLAGLYYERREIEGQGITKFRGVVLKEYEIAVSDEGVWSLTTLRDEFNTGSDVQTNTLDGSTRDFHTTQTSTSPIAIYYVGEELQFVYAECVIEYRNIATTTSVAADIKHPIPNLSDRPYVVSFPITPPAGWKSSGVFPFSDYVIFAGGTITDIQFKAVSSMKVKIIFGGSDEINLTDYSSTSSGTSHSESGNVIYDFYNTGFFLRARAYYNSMNTYTDEQSSWAQGYIGQVRYLNAAMRILAYAKTTHDHNVVYDKENFYKWSLDSDFDNGTGNTNLFDGTYSGGLTDTEYGYTEASDNAYTDFILYTNGNSRTISSKSTVNLADSVAQTAKADKSEATVHVQDYEFIYKEVPEYDKPGHVIFPDNAYIASAGIYGPYSCCFDWEETHLASTQNPDPPTRTYIWVYQEDSVCSLQSAKSGNLVVHGKTAPDVSFRFLNTSFPSVSFALSDPDIYPIRWANK